MEDEEEDMRDEEEDMNDTINMEVVYMVRQTEADYDDDKDDGDWQLPPRQVCQCLHIVGSVAGRSGHLSYEVKEVQENPLHVKYVTLTEI